MILIERRKDEPPQGWINEIIQQLDGIGPHMRVGLLELVIDQIDIFGTVQQAQEPEDLLSRFLHQDAEEPHHRIAVSQDGGRRVPVGRRHPGDPLVGLHLFGDLPPDQALRKLQPMRMAQPQLGQAADELLAHVFVILHHEHPQEAVDRLLAGLLDELLDGGAALDHRLMAVLQAFLEPVQRRRGVKTAARRRALFVSGERLQQPVAAFHQRAVGGKELAGERQLLLDGGAGR